MEQAVIAGIQGGDVKYQWGILACVLAVAGAVNASQSGAASTAGSGSEVEGAQQYFSVGADMLERGTLDAARAMLDRALELDPAHIAARIALSVVFAGKGDLPASVAILEAGLLVVPADPQLQYSLALRLAQMKDWTRALEVLNQRMAVDPAPKVRILRALVLRDLGSTDLAMQDLDLAIEADAKSPEPYRLKASLLRNLGRMNEIPLLVARMHAALGPPAANQAAISVLTTSGLNAEARPYLDDELRVNPTAELYLSRANLQQAKSAILADLAAALGQPDPGYMSHSIVISRLFQRQWYGETVEMLSRMEVERGTLAPRMRAVRGMARWKLGEFAAARVDLAAASKGAIPTLLNSLCWDKARYDAALEVALEECNAAVAAEPRCAACIDSMALVLLRMGRLEDSIEAYSHALRLDPALAMSLYGRGVARIRSGRQAEGEADIAAARNLSPTVALEFMTMGFMTVPPPAAADPG